MVAVRDAVKLSLETLRELFPGESMPDLRLEEVMLSDDERRWEVTVSYLNPDFERDLASRERGNHGLAQFLTEKQNVPTRLYKTVSLNAELGTLLGVRNEWETFGA